MSHVCRSVGRIADSTDHVMKTRIRSQNVGSPGARVLQISD